jgi:hypothetical protein
MVRNSLWLGVFFELVACAAHLLHCGVHIYSLVAASLLGSGLLAVAVLVLRFRTSYSPILHHYQAVQRRE